MAINRARLEAPATAASTVRSSGRGSPTPRQTALQPVVQRERLPRRHCPRDPRKVPVLRPGNRNQCGSPGHFGNRPRERSGTVLRNTLATVTRDITAITPRMERAPGSRQTPDADPRPQCDIPSRSSTKRNDSTSSVLIARRHHIWGPRPRLIGNNGPNSGAYRGIAPDRAFAAGRRISLRDRDDPLVDSALFRDYATLGATPHTTQRGILRRRQLATVSGIQLVRNRPGSSAARTLWAWNKPALEGGSSSRAFIPHRVARPTVLERLLKPVFDSDSQGCPHYQRVTKAQFGSGTTLSGAAPAALPSMSGAAPPSPP